MFLKGKESSLNKVSSFDKSNCYFEIYVTIKLRVRGIDSGDTDVEYANEKVNPRFKTLLAYDGVATAVIPNQSPILNLV